MYQLRNSVFIRLLWGIMGLFLLNISVDTADPKPEYISEDLSFNDQESIVEIVLEQVLGFQDALEEYDDHDSEDHNKQGAKVNLFPHVALSDGISVYAAFQKHLFPAYQEFFFGNFHQIDTPPPRI